MVPLTGATTVSTTTLPEQVQRAGSDLQCKAAVCLGHCFTNLPNIPSNQNQKNDDNILWSDFIQPSFHSLASDRHETFAKKLFVYLSEDVQQAVCTTAVAALRSRPTLQQYILAEQDEVDHLLAVLPTSTTTNPLSTLSVTRSLIVRDIINVLGIVVSQQDHTIDIDRKVCRAMMNVLLFMGDEIRKVSTVTPNSTGVSYRYVVITSEIINAIMDIYGKDDCYLTVFTNLDCLTHLQKTTPLLKKHIGILRAAVHTSNTGSNNMNDYDYYTYDDIEQWKEIMLNTNRFVQ